MAGRQGNKIGSMSKMIRPERRARASRTKNPQLRNVRGPANEGHGSKNIP